MSTVVAATAARQEVLVAAGAALVAGALSMAAVEYVGEFASGHRKGGWRLSAHCDHPRRTGTRARAFVSVVAVFCLVALGAVAARIGGAPMLVGTARVTIWGMLSMLVTAAVGGLFGATMA